MQILRDNKIDIILDNEDDITYMKKNLKIFLNYK